MILFVGAMKEELSDVVENNQAILVETGIGKVNAAMKLTEAIHKYHVTHIYNVGFAGASKHFEIGQMVLIEEAKYHDFDLTFFGYEEGQVPGYPAAFKSDEKLIEDVMKKYPNIQKATLFTGDYFMTEAVDKPYVADMEGAALYQVAHHYQIPMISIKIISDIVGMDDHYASYKKFETHEGSMMIAKIYDQLFKE